VNERLVHLVIRLYPRSWRDRYGEEFEALLIAEPGSLRALVNVVRSALREHILPAHPSADTQRLLSFGLIATKPSAVVPIGMSLAAFAAVLVQIAVAGIARQRDEGAAAHIWQLLMAAQMPVLLCFAIKWLPKAPRQALCVLALQAAALMASMAPVFLLKW
jgi:hypothetical protein